ncbi:hypothetical protein GGR58DRAFT_468944 [Xylaria digitata]|nr:hypothetical protein GGR58DRAFT_468944 [Xylaria digitata]
MPCSSWAPWWCSISGVYPGCRQARLEGGCATSAFKSRKINLATTPQGYRRGMCKEVCGGVVYPAIQPTTVGTMCMLEVWRMACCVLRAACLRGRKRPEQSSG